MWCIWRINGLLNRNKHLKNIYTYSSMKSRLNQFILHEII